MARYRQSWKEVVLAPLNVVWRPHLLSILLFEVCRLPPALSIPAQACNFQGVLFGFGIGFHVSVAPLYLLC